jgi:uncharacterized protein YdiU (UPF0061 family)
VFSLARALVLLMEQEGSDGAVVEMQAIVGAEFNATLKCSLAAMHAAKLGVLVGAPAELGEEEAQAHLVEGLWVGLVGENPPLGSRSATEVVRGLLERSEMDYTIFFRELSTLAGTLQANLSHPSGGSEHAVSGGLAPLPDAAGLIQMLERASCTPEAVATHRQEWLEWLALWHSTADGERAGAIMVATNPKFVPREWMLAEAYTAAEAGDFTIVHQLQHLFASPYAEHSAEMEAKYYKTTPAHMEDVAGIAYFS